MKRQVLYEATTEEYEDEAEVRSRVRYRITKCLRPNA